MNTRMAEVFSPFLFCLILQGTHHVMHNHLFSITLSKLAFKRYLTVNTIEFLCVVQNEREK